MSIQALYHWLKVRTKSFVWLLPDQFSHDLDNTLLLLVDLDRWRFIIVHDSGWILWWFFRMVFRSIDNDDSGKIFCMLCWPFLFSSLFLFWLCWFVVRFDEILVINYLGCFAASLLFLAHCLSAVHLLRLFLCPAATEALSARSITRFISTLLAFPLSVELARLHISTKNLNNSKVFLCLWDWRTKCCKPQEKNSSRETSSVGKRLRNCTMTRCKKPNNQ